MYFHKGSNTDGLSTYCNGCNCKYSTKYSKDNIDTVIKKAIIHRKNRMSNDPSFKLRINISNIIRSYLNKNNSSKDYNSCKNYLNFSPIELKNHLEKQFEPWMNWNNWGKYNSKTWNDNDSSTWTWQMDHIIPQSDLPYKSMEDDNFKKCWDLSNLRPYSAKQNILDGVNSIRHIKKSKENKVFSILFYS
jgi:hypothetical protein